MNKKTLDQFKEKEKCVVCKTKTNVSKETHIKNRYFYVEGVGQLCAKCYNLVYEPIIQI